MLFSITVEEKPERANELSGLMCMAISGGAIVPLLMGKLVDSNFKAHGLRRSRRLLRLPVAALAQGRPETGRAATQPSR